MCVYCQIHGSQWPLRTSCPKSKRSREKVVRVLSPNIRYIEVAIESNLKYTNALAHSKTTPGGYETQTVKFRCTCALFYTKARTKSTDLILMFHCGNNGSTLTATRVAGVRSFEWRTCAGVSGAT